MMIGRKGDCVSMHSVILWSAALLVPRSARAEWLDEWRSELWYVLQRSEHAPRHLWWDREALLFCLGAFKDVRWLRRNDCSPNRREHTWLQSPKHCLLFLAAVAAIAISGFFRSTGPYETIIHAAQGGTVILAQLGLITMALLALPVATSLTVGEYPAAPRSPVRARRFRRWLFLEIKFALIFSVVFCGTLSVAPIVILPQLTVAGYLLAFRWVLIDQRRRCPVCLRLLTNPARIGRPCQILLGWYGTEYLCEKGHGLMYVPEIRTTYSKQRWLDLDSSWGSLFS